MINQTDLLSSMKLTRINSYSPEPVSADVSYDAFVSAGHKAEIMIWLAAYNLSPISKTDTTLHTENEIPGWDLFVGTTAQIRVLAKNARRYRACEWVQCEVYHLSIHTLE